MYDFGESNNTRHKNMYDILEKFVEALARMVMKMHLEDGNMDVYGAKKG